jgi:hypothetical protein
MNYSKQDQLEACVERHRADFDLHEPRPELWAALEKQLHDSGTGLAEPVMSVVADIAATTSQAAPTVPVMAQPAPRKRWAWAEHYSIAAALAVLILAAGLGEAWKSGQVIKERTAANVATEMPASNVADAALYLGASGELMASEVSHSTNARLDTAVRGMETYYVGQLADRKAELGQLSPEAVAECSRELADLDSLYRQLKRELPSHPQPEVVLTAMNRNLQYRLDILNRQLELRNPTESALPNETRGEYALADSRRSSPSILHHGH